MSRSSAARLRPLPGSSCGAPDRGAAAVEFALVVPLLLVLLFGITEFGRAYNTQATLTQAARVGADAVVRGGTSTDARAATRLAAAGSTLTDADIAVSRSTCLGAAPSDAVEVRVTRQQVFLTGLFGSTLTLTGTATMRCRV